MITLRDVFAVYLPIVEASIISRVRKGTTDTKCYHIVEVEDDE